MYILQGGLTSVSSKDPEWGTFIAPDKELEKLRDPNEKFNAYIPSGNKADFSPFLSLDPLFTSIVAKLIAQRAEINFEDQCSAKYYFDCFSILKKMKGKVRRIAEAGTYLGGASCVFAGCVQPFELELDLIDAKKEFLLFTYERIRRAFPEAITKVRLFFGDIPTYVKNVVAKEDQTDILIHHDASHNFNEVVRDLASLYYVKEKLHGIIIQDTHLRSAKLDRYIFVDAAVYAIFGFNIHFMELGAKFGRSTEPAYAGKTYFIDHHAEGFYLPFGLNHFLYPHPNMKMEETIIENCPA